MKPIDRTTFISNVEREAVARKLGCELCDHSRLNHALVFTHPNLKDAVTLVITKGRTLSMPWQRKILARARYHAARVPQWEVLVEVVTEAIRQS